MVVERQNYDAVTDVDIIVGRCKYMVIIGMIFLIMAVLSFPVYGQNTGLPEDDTIDRQMKGEIIDSVCAALNKIYVFPDVAKEMEKLVRTKLKKKEYDKIDSREDFARTLTDDLRSISHDLHLWLRAASPEAMRLSQEDSLTDEELAQKIEEGKYDNFNFVKVERLPGNIGYLGFNGFSDATFAGGTAVAALNFLAYTDALIIDLRENGGGSPSMIQLISSYFFDEPKHLNSFYVRETDSIQQFWTQASVQGPRMTDVDLYILTSGYTFSAAEEFTYNMKNLERATIIGETTGGGAHPVTRKTFKNIKMTVSVPYGRAINPITGTNWEGVGIKPHIEVSKDEAFEVAVIEATKKLIEKETDEKKKGNLTWYLENLEALRNPFVVSEDLLKKYAGKYGPRNVIYENGILFYQREDRPKYKLIPINIDTFMPDGLDYFRLQFVSDENGEISMVKGIYNNGRVDISERD